MPEPVQPTSQQALPSEIAERLRDWKRLWKWSNAFHLIFGGLSVLCSALAATGMSGSQALAAAAAVMTALIGFAGLERRYYKFVRAWRVLNVAAIRYRLGLTDVSGLVTALERGETLISEFEDTKEPLEGRKTGADGAIAPG